MACIRETDETQKLFEISWTMKKQMKLARLVTESENQGSGRLKFVQQYKPRDFLKNVNFPVACTANNHPPAEQVPVVQFLKILGGS